MKLDPHQNYEGLPLPRLELRWVMVGADWTDKACIYELVMPLGHYDIRAEDDQGNHGKRAVIRHQLGKTASRGADKMPVFDGKVDAPFRDGAHALWDAKMLGLPLYATCETSNTKLYPTLKALEAE